MSDAPAIMTTVRRYTAATVRIVTTAFAVVLVLGAVLIALGDVVNRDNGIVSFIVDAAEAVDGPFSRDGGIFSFDGEGLTTLTNWGIGAAVWLLIGRVVSGLIDK